MEVILRAVRRQGLGAPLALMLATWVCAACEASDIAWEGGPSIIITPLQARLPAGDTIRIRATADGRPCDCLWASLDGTRATVDATGLVRALAPGSTSVIATYRRDQNVKVSALIEVVAP